MKRHCSVSIDVKFALKAKAIKDALAKIPDTAEVEVVRGYTGNQYDSSPDALKFSWDEEL